MANEAIPLWAIGRHMSNVLFTPQTVNTTTGALTDTTPTRQFFANLQSVEVDNTVTFENLSAMDRPVENNVPIEGAQVIRLEEFEKSAGTNLAAAVAFGATYWKYVLTRGAQAFTGYSTFGSYRMNATKPRIMASLEMRQIDVGTSAASFTYS